MIFCQLLILKAIARLFFALKGAKPGALADYLEQGHYDCLGEKP